MALKKRNNTLLADAAAEARIAAMAPFPAEGAASGSTSSVSALNVRSLLAFLLASATCVLKLSTRGPAAAVARA